MQNVDFVETNTKTNVVASFCTSYARLKLWGVINLLGSYVLYHDMDFVIYTKNLGWWEPPMGQYLGDLMNELSCNDVRCSGCYLGHWIVEFISCRAKNYAYHLNSGEVVCKVRGFSLKFSASQVVNLDTMKKALLAWKNKQDQKLSH